MIFCFSGTGNSLHAASIIARAQDDRLISITGELAHGQQPYELAVHDSELLGFVYPVHAWAPPRLVLDFIRRLRVSGGRPHVFSVCTCGDEEGMSSRILAKALGRSGLTLDCAFALRMPNNYIIGFEKDPEPLEQEKLAASERRLEAIVQALGERRRDAFEWLPGRWPRLKSGVVNPLFRHFATDTRPFCATDACSGCGLCESVCPLGSIKRVGRRGRPVWSHDCTMCLACLNRCPEAAIQYGRRTIGKQRYVHPDLRPD